MTKPIPEGFTTVTASLTVKEASKAIEFYKKAFDAKDLNRFAGPDGKIMHAEIKIGNSIVMLNDEDPGMNCKSPQSLGGTGSSIFLYVNDADVDRKSTRLNSSHIQKSRMPSSA